jgi:septal ring factor EnvC (AmiA/AmiB activator)
MKSMKKKLMVALLVCLALALSAALAAAQHGPKFHQFDKQIAKQQRAIDRGVVSGKLTHREADIVQDNLNHIRAKLDRYRGNDGRLDPRERDRLQGMLDRNDRMIRKLKHNSIRRVY